MTQEFIPEIAEIAKYDETQNFVFVDNSNKEDVVFDGGEIIPTKLITFEVDGVKYFFDSTPEEDAEYLHQEMLREIRWESMHS